MYLTKLISSPERIRILEHILLFGKVTNQDVVEKVHVNKGLASIYLNMLADRGIIKKEGRIYSTSDSAIVRSLKRFLNMERLSLDGLETGWTKGIGIFGSWADGTNTDESDLDVWVRVDSIDNERIARFRRSLSERTGYEVNILPLTDERIRSMKEQDTLFFRNVKYGSVVLSGEGIG